MMKCRSATVPAGAHSAEAGPADSLRHLLAAVALGLSVHPVWGTGLFTPVDAADAVRFGHHAASPMPSIADRSADGEAPAKGWLVRVDRPQLFRTIHKAARQGSGRILLNVAEGLEFDVAVERTGPTLSGYSLSGSVVGVAGGVVTLVVNAEVLMGTVWTPKAAYEIAHLRDGVHVFREVGPSTMPHLCEPAQAEGGWGELPLVERTDAAGDDVVDVLILWTPKALENAGGEAQMRAASDLAVAWTNDAYERSGAVVRLNLVGAEQVDYVEYCEECFEYSDLESLEDPSDGFMDEAHRRRDHLGADLVSLFTGVGHYGGIAKLAGAFSVVVVRKESTQYLSAFAHELGHNMGLAHDRYATSFFGGGNPPGVLGFSNGYVNKRAFDLGASPDDCWKTIMAYPNRCRDHGIARPRQVPYFSTPDRNHPEDEDAPLGVSKWSDDGVDGPADAVRTLNLTARRVANFRSGRTDDGDTAETATPILATSKTFATLTDGGDVDYFRVELPEAGWLQAEITDGFSYNTLYLSVALVTDDGELVAEDRSSPFLIEAELAAGVYFIKVEEAAAVYGYEEYALVLQFRPAGVADDHGDWPWEATAAVLPSSIAGELQSSVDADYFRFAVAERGVVRLETAGDTDVMGALTSEDGTLGLTDDDSGAATNFQLVAKLDPGVYFVAVTGFAGATGAYSLNLTFADAPDDHADSAEAATVLEVGASASGELEVPLDQDYFSIEVAGDSPGQLWVESTGDTDVEGRLLSRDGTLLDVAAYGGDHPNFVVGAHVVPGSYFLRVVAYRDETPTGSYALTATFIADNRTLPLFISASHPTRQGFARIINRSDRSGDVAIHAVDDAGQRPGPITLSLDAGQTAHFNADDLENGNEAKGLSGGVGAGEGDWRLELATDLDIEALAYVRTNDGFLTSMHDLSGMHDASDVATAPTFNPASNLSQVSKLRLISQGPRELSPNILGADDGGSTNRVILDVAEGASLTVTAQELENGGVGVRGSLGDGDGKWRLHRFQPWTPWAQPVGIMSLLESPTGHLTNLSRRTPMVGTDVSLPLFIAADNPVRQGFARIINYSLAGEVTIHAIDDSGERRGPITLPLAAGQAAHFNSHDLENGNPAKGLSGGVGPSEGDWRLEFSATAQAGWLNEVHIEALAYVRTADGFLTGMNALAPSSNGVHEVVFFNPGSNSRQVSKLRLVNPADADAAVTVSGVDDAGNAAPAGDVTLTVPAGAAAEITAQQLEAGADHFDGRFGDGQGKWRLFIEADKDIQAMSLLESPTGHIANLSSGTAVR